MKQFQSRKTKRVLVLGILWLWLLGGVGVHAQVPDLGVKAGVNFGTLRAGSDAVKGESGKAGWHVGLFTRVGDDFYFQPEVNFSTFKSEYRYDATTVQPAFRQLNVPLMAGYKVINNDHMNLRLSLGPDVIFNLNKPEAVGNEAYKRFGVGGVVNAGVDIGRLTFDARYGLGLTNLHDGLEQKQGIFSIGVGFKIL